MFCQRISRKSESSLKNPGTRTSGGIVLSLKKVEYLRNMCYVSMQDGTPGSQMHLKYLHYLGNESNESLLEAYGIVA